MNVFKIKKITVRVEGESFGQAGNMELLVTDKDGDHNPEISVSTDLPGKMADFKSKPVEIPVGSILTPIIDLVSAGVAVLPGGVGPAASMMVQGLKALIP